MSSYADDQWKARGPGGAPPGAASDPGRLVWEAHSSGAAPRGTGRGRQAAPELFSHNLPNPSPTETSCYDPNWSGHVAESACASAEERGEGTVFRAQAPQRGKENPAQATRPSQQQNLHLDNRSLLCGEFSNLGMSLLPHPKQTPAALAATTPPCTEIGESTGGLGRKGWTPVLSGVGGGTRPSSLGQASPAETLGHARLHSHRLLP